MSHKKDMTAAQEWIQSRISVVESHYSTFDCLMENGYSEHVADESTATQIPCPDPEHGPDNRPSARYYPRSGGRPSHIYCFKCKFNASVVNLYAKFKGRRFMDALTDLERRFKIRVARKPDAPEFTDPVDRDSKYVSERWGDVPYVLGVLESKLKRLRDKASLADYVKFCRVLDHVSFDYDVLERSTPEMVSVLAQLRSRMHDASVVTDDMFTDPVDP